jgi:hypothetical protein
VLARPPLFATARQPLPAFQKLSRGALTPSQEAVDALVAAGQRSEEDVILWFVLRREGETRRILAEFKKTKVSAAAAAKVGAGAAGAPPSGAGGKVAAAVAAKGAAPPPAAAKASSKGKRAAPRQQQTSAQQTAAALEVAPTTVTAAAAPVSVGIGASNWLPCYAIANAVERLCPGVTFSQPIYFFYPLSLGQLQRMLTEFAGEQSSGRRSRVLLKALSFEHSVVFPLGWCFHWRIVIIDSRLKCISFLDPVGDSIESFLSGPLLAAFPGWRVESCAVKLQNDGYNCGVWVIYFAELFKRFKSDRRTLTDETFVAWLRGTAFSADKAATAKNFIAQRRATYRALLEGASLNGVDGGRTKAAFVVKLKASEGDTAENAIKILDDNSDDVVALDQGPPEKAAPAQKAKKQRLKH